MRRLIWLPLAGFLLIGGAAVGAAATDLLATAPAATASDSDSETEVNGESDVKLRWGRGEDLLAETLTDLVTQGVITQDQQDAIIEALDARREAKRAELQAAREQMRSFLEDGVITQAEIDQLPADHPLRSLTTLLDDGQITLDELRDLHGGFNRFGPGRGEGRGPGHFRGPDWMFQAPGTGSDSDSDSDSNPDPDAGSDG